MKISDMPHYQNPKSRQSAEKNQGFIGGKNQGTAHVEPRKAQDVG